MNLKNRIEKLLAKIPKPDIRFKMTRPVIAISNGKTISPAGMTFGELEELSKKVRPIIIGGVVEDAD